MQDSKYAWLPLPLLPSRETHTHTRTRSQKSNFQPCQFLSQQLPSLDAFPACQGSFSQPKERVTWLWGRSLSPNFPGPSGCDLRCCATGAAAGPQGASKARGCPAAGAWHRFSPPQERIGVFCWVLDGEGIAGKHKQREGTHLAEKTCMAPAVSQSQDAPASRKTKHARLILCL